jgi:uncharacterized repeat protein (TIGR03847 family)
VPRRIVDIDDPGLISAALETHDEDDCHIEVVRRGRRVSVLLEREQLARVADGIAALVDELERRGLVAIEVGPVDMLPGRPVRRHAFRAETIMVAWDDDGHRVVIEARAAETDGGAGDHAHLPGPAADDEPDDASDDDPVGPDVLRVRLRPHMAQRFARQAARLSGGRPRAAGDVGPDAR